MHSNAPDLKDSFSFYLHYPRALAPHGSLSLLGIVGSLEPPPSALPLVYLPLQA
jgi:hypothetical protein